MNPPDPATNREGTAPPSSPNSASGNDHTETVPPVSSPPASNAGDPVVDISAGNAMITELSVSATSTTSSSSAALINTELLGEAETNAVIAAVNSTDGNFAAVKGRVLATNTLLNYLSRARDALLRERNTRTEAEQQLAEANTQVANLTTALSFAHHQQQQQPMVSEELMVELTRLENLASSRESYAGQLEAKADSLTKKIKELEDEKKARNEAAEKSRVESDKANSAKIARLQEKADALLNKNKTMQKTIKELENGKETLEEENMAMSLNYDMAMNETGELKKEIDILKRNESSATATIASLRRELEALKAHKRDAGEAQVTALKRELEALKASKRSAGEAQVSALKRELEGLKAHVRNKEAQESELKHELETLKAGKHEPGDFQALKVENARIRTELEKIKADRKILKANNEKLKIEKLALQNYFTEQAVKMYQTQETSNRTHSQASPSAWSSSDNDMDVHMYHDVPSSPSIAPSPASQSLPSTCYSPPRNDSDTAPPPPRRSAPTTPIYRSPARPSSTSRIQRAATPKATASSSRIVSPTPSQPLPARAAHPSAEAPSSSSSSSSSSATLHSQFEQRRPSSTASGLVMPAPQMDRATPKKDFAHPTYTKKQKAILKRTKNLAESSQKRRRVSVNARVPLPMILDEPENEEDTDANEQKKFGPETINTISNQEPGSILEYSNIHFRKRDVVNQSFLKDLTDQLNKFYHEISTFCYINIKNAKVFRFGVDGDVGILSLSSVPQKELRVAYYVYALSRKHDILRPVIRWGTNCCIDAMKNKKLPLACRYTRLIAILCSATKDYDTIRTFCYSAMRAAPLDANINFGYIILNCAALFKEALDLNSRITSGANEIVKSIQCAVAHSCKQKDAWAKSVYTPLTLLCNWTPLSSTPTPTARLDEIITTLKSDHFRSLASLNHTLHAEVAFTLVKAFDLVAYHMNDFDVAYNDYVTNKLWVLAMDELLVDTAMDLISCIIAHGLVKNQNTNLHTRRKSIQPATDKPAVKETRQKFAVILSANMSTEFDVRLQTAAAFGLVRLSSKASDIEAVTKWCNNLPPALRKTMTTKLASRQG